MVTKLLYFMFTFMAVMAAGPALAALLIYLLKADIGVLIARHSLAASLIFALYGAFISFMYFALQDRFIVFRPPAGTAPVTKTELLGRLEKAFSTPIEGKQLFDFVKKDNRAILTWAADVAFFQGVSIGGRGMKRVLVLTCDEAGHDVYFIMRDKDWRWSASTLAFNFSMNYSLGLSAEFTSEWYPSIEYSPDTGLKVDVKKLTYSSQELMQPVQSAVLSSGWTLRGGMIPGFYYRLLFCLPLALLFFLVGCFVGWVGSGKAPQQTPAAATTRIEIPVMTSDQYAASLRQSLPYMTLQSLHLQLEGIMHAPASNFRPEFKAAFTIYGKAYLESPNRDPEFSEQLKKFATEKDLPLATP